MALQTEQQVQREEGQDEDQFGPMLISRLEVRKKKLAVE